MFQVDITPHASDAIEDAMRLAQIKALNSFTFSDCLNYLNYAWSDIYSRVAMIDDGFYGQTVKLTQKLTHLPKYVKNTVQIYRAQSPIDYNRLVYRDAGTTDIVAHGTYKISGFDLYCADVERYGDIWLYYVPACPQVFYTHLNRTPTQPGTYYNPAVASLPTGVLRTVNYNLYTLKGYNNETEVPIGTSSVADIESINKLVLVHKSGNTEYDKDITDKILKTELSNEEKGTWKLRYISCDYPYIFCTYALYVGNDIIRRESGFYNNNFEWTRFNPFDFTGRPSNVEYMQTKWNDKTGLGVYICDYNDLQQGTNGYIVKNIGWTPDTKLIYPAPEMYRYLVARLADKFAALNESNIMGVKKELIEARYAFEAFLNKDKSAWQRITNVNATTIGDWL